MPRNALMNERFGWSFVALVTLVIVGSVVIESKGQAPLSTRHASTEAPPSSSSPRVLTNWEEHALDAGSHFGWTRG